VQFSRKTLLKLLGLIGLAGLFFAFGAVGTYYYFDLDEPKAPPTIEGIKNLETGKPENVDFSIFWDTWLAIQAKYVGRNKLDFEAMVYGAAKGLVDSLGDPYSVFLTPAERKEFDTDIAGRFEGIGIEIGLRKGILTVIAPLESTPAKAAGLKASDQILQIDEESTAGLSLDEAVTRIRGPKGTTVSLLIFRQGWGEPREFPIERDVINVPSVTWEPIGDDVAHLRVHNFNEKSFREFRQAALQILGSNRTRIVLDLRNNPGGFFESAVDMAGWFLKRGSVVVKEDEGEGPFVCKTCTANGSEAFLNHKVVLLINAGSASASEILAGALRDNRGLKLVGEKTFGKGSVQEVNSLREGASVKVTVAKWLTPSGVDITEKGLEPDILVEESDEDAKDLQLEKAVEEVRKL
jgi:carboxyl-terminal processing protease